MKHQDNLNIPIELLIYCLKNKVVNQTILYLYLKTSCSGRFILNDDFIKKALCDLKIKTQFTFYKNLTWLIKNKWITVNYKFNKYKVKGYKDLAFKLEFSSRTGVILEPIEFKNLRPFIYAAVITYFGNFLKRREKLAGMNKWRSYLSQLPSSLYFQLPHSYLAQALCLSISTVEGYRIHAIKAGYIESKKNYSELNISDREAQYLRKYSDEFFITRIKGKWYKQGADFIKSKLVFRIKKRMKKNL